MKKTFVFSFVFIITVISVFISHASASPRMQMIADKTELPPGEVTNIDLRIKEIIPVYGAEMVLTFNPDVLEVIPDKSDSGKIAIQPGDFFNLSQKHFPLQNRADNKSGRIYYAMSMLNPALEAQGEGILAQIAFRAKAEGDANLKMETAKFGTRDGRTVIPDTAPPVQIQVRNRSGNWQGFAVTASTAMLIFAGMFFMRRRRKKS